MVLKNIRTFHTQHCELVGKVFLGGYDLGWILDGWMDGQFFWGGVRSLVDEDDV